MGITASQKFVKLLPFKPLIISYEEKTTPFEDDEATKRLVCLVTISVVGNS